MDSALRNDQAVAGAKAVWTEAWRLVQATRIETILYIAASFAIWGPFDLGCIDDDFVVLAWIADFAVGYYLVASMLKRGDLAPHGLYGGIGTYFVASLFSGIAIGIGFIFLIIPGVIILVGLLPLYGFALAEDRPVMDSFGDTWEETRDVFWPLFVAFFLPMLALYVPVFWVFFGNLEATIFAELTDGVEQSYSMFEFFLTAIAALGFLISTAIGLASYSLLRGEEDALRDVFE